MAKNQPQIDIGQGGAILIATTAYTPPTGKVIVAVNFLEDSTIEAITPANDTNCRYLSVTSDGDNANANAGADGVGAKSLIQHGETGVTTFGVASEGTFWMYGRYSAIQLGQGKAICYLADA